MKTLIYDGTIEGFLSCIFYSYEQNEFNYKISSGLFLQENLFDNIVEIFTDNVKAERVKNGIIKKVGVNLLNEINTVFCSGDENKDTILFEYLKLVFAFGLKARLMLNNEAVTTYNAILKKVTYERHRMIGFLRFSETIDNIMYAKYSPDNNITHLLLGHFADRFSKENFIIHDTKRNILGVYSANTNEFFTYTLTNELQKITLTSDETFFQKLWQNYYHDTAILERKNTPLMMAHLPRRYHPNLTELKS